MVEGGGNRTRLPTSTQARLRLELQLRMTGPDNPDASWPGAAGIYPSLDTVIAPKYPHALF